MRADAFLAHTHLDVWQRSVRLFDHGDVSAIRRLSFADISTLVRLKTPVIMVSFSSKLYAAYPACFVQNAASFGLIFSYSEGSAISEHPTDLD